MINLQTRNTAQKLHPKAKYLAFCSMLLGASTFAPFLIDAAFAMDSATLPSGGNVVGGAADFDYATPNKLNINQKTDRVIIDWSSFNIGSDATTQFHQPSGSSLAVNRISGTSLDPTMILGTLKANGQIIVLDQNGVIFGQGSTVDVGGIIASTGNINTQAVMRGESTLQFTDIKNGSIVNQGTISVSDAGIAAFVAPSVRNNGIIQAKMGKVALASGTMATIDLYGDGLIEVGIDGPLSNSLVENTGSVHAEGGKILLTAATAKNIVNSVVNNTGYINASSATNVGGKIILSGDTVSVAGKINASGKKGGGEILIGGDYQGKGSVKTSGKTTIAKTAEITASASGQEGHGGKIIVWADNETIVSGKIEAKGGSASGDGGFIETSAKEHLTVDQEISVSAASGNALGKSGTWLIDPQNIVISDTGTIGGATDSKIASSTINATLNGGTDMIITTNSAGVGDGDIILVNANIHKSTSNNEVNLVLQAQRDILFGNSSIQNTSSDKLNVVFNADRDANQIGGIYMNGSTINTAGGYIVMGGGSGTLWGVGGADTTAAYATNRSPDAYSSFTSYTDGVFIYSSTINSGAGNIIINGHASASGTDMGVQIQGSTFKTSTGNIRISGTSGTGASSVGGIVINQKSLLETDEGDITLSGVSNSSGSISSGTSTAISVGGGSTIKTTTQIAGKGNITLDGDASGSTASVTRGIDLASSSSSTPTYITTQRGNISLSGREAVNSYGEAITMGWRGIEIESQNGGNITLDAKGGMLNLATINSTQHFKIGHENTDTVKIIAGALKIAGATPTTSAIGGKNVIIQPSDPTKSIGVANGTGNFVLNSNALKFFKATEKLVVGDIATSKGDINIDRWDLSGTSYNVELYGNDITVSDGTSSGYGIRLGDGSLLAHARDNTSADRGDININASILKSSAPSSKLDLRADYDIIVNGSSIASSGGALNTILNSDRDAGNDGAIYINSGTIDTKGGYLVLGGGAGTVGGVDGILGNGDGTGADDVAAHGTSTRSNGVFIGGATTIHTQGGHFVANGIGSSLAANGAGVRINGSSQIFTDAGTLKITGKGANGTGNNTGISLENNSILDSKTGGISLVGTGGTATGGSNNQGVAVLSGSTIRSSGTGSTAAKIYIEGNSGGATVAAQSLNLTAGATITTTDGDIEIYGKSANGTSSMTSNQDFTVESKGSGNILIKLDDTGVNNNAITFAANGVQTIGHADMTGNITIVTKAFTNYDASDRILTQGSIKILAPDAARDIVVGAPGTAANLVLSDLFLGTLTAGKLVIGDALLTTGNITIDSWDLAGKAHNIELYGNTIQTIGSYGIQNASGATLLFAKNKIDLDSSITSTGALTFSGTNGITIADADIKATGITALQDIVYDGTGNTTRTIDAGTGTLSLQGVSAGTNNLRFIADNAALNGNVTVDASHALSLQTATDGRTIHLGSGTGGLDIDGTEFSRLSAGILNVGNATSFANDIVVNGISLTGKDMTLVSYAKDISIHDMAGGNGNILFYSKGSNGLSVTGNNILNGSGQLGLLAMDGIQIDGSIANNGTGRIGLFSGWDGTSGLTVPSALSFDDVRIANIAKDIILGNAGRLSSNASDTAILLVSSGNFKNNAAAGSSAITTSNGRYLAYGTSPTDSVKGGLTASNLYNKTYDSALPSTVSGGSRFIYSDQPPLTLTVNDLSWPDATSASYSYSLSGLITGDNPSDALSGLIGYISIDNGDGTHTVSIDPASINSPIGYKFGFQSGTLTLSAPPLVPAPGHPYQPSPLPTNIVHYSSNLASYAHAPENGDDERILDATQTQRSSSKGDVGCLVIDGISGGCITP